MWGDPLQNPSPPMLVPFQKWTKMGYGGALWVAMFNEALPQYTEGGVWDFSPKPPSPFIKKVMSRRTPTDFVV